MFKKNNKKRKGFSLIELIVVIGILAVLTVTAIAQYGDLAERAEQAALTADANILARSLNMFNVLNTNGADVTAITSVAGTANGNWSGGAVHLNLDANDLLGEAYAMSVTIPSDNLTAINGPYLYYDSTTSLWLVDEEGDHSST